MIVIFDHEFYPPYTSDPAAEKGRLEAIVDEISTFAEIEPCIHATEEQILAVHSRDHLEYGQMRGSIM